MYVLKQCSHQQIFKAWYSNRFSMIKIAFLFLDEYLEGGKSERKTEGRKAGKNGRQKVFRLFHSAAPPLQFLVPLLSNSKGMTKWREIKGDNIVNCCVISFQKCSGANRKWVTPRLYVTIRDRECFHKETLVCKLMEVKYF